MDEGMNGSGVSVALGTYNGAPYLAEQLQSILDQTVPIAQLVVADDGSRDDTLAIVASVVADHRAAHPHHVLRVDVLTGEQPLGVAANFERALQAASEPVIALSDQDDVWRPDRLERALAVLAAHPEVDLVQSDARLVDAAGADLGTTLFGALGVGAAEVGEIAAGRSFELFLRRNLVTGATTVLRASLRDRALPVPLGWIHDEWLAIVAAATARTAVVAEPLIDYRQHGANQIGVRRATLADRYARLREPRQPRNARLLARAESLAGRLPTMDAVAPERIAAAEAKLAHERRRSALPAWPLARVPRVVASAAAGDYRRFGNGMQDVLRDLVQPAGSGSA